MARKLIKNTTIALVLALAALLFAALPAQAKVLYYDYWGSCIWTIDSNGALTIYPGTGADPEYVDDDFTPELVPRYPWNDYKESITSIVAVAENGQKIVAPANSSELFSDMPNLTSVNLSGLDTSNVENMSYMFYNCAALKKLDLSGFKTSKVTDMRSMFCYCSSLTTVNVSKFDTSHVTDMALMFYGCSSIESLNLSSFNISQVTWMGQMLGACVSLRTLALSKLFVLSGISQSVFPPADHWVDGLWVASSDGSSYYADELIERGVAETYTRANLDGGMWGTCPWEISFDGVLTIHPGTGSNELTWENEYGSAGVYSIPWHDYGYAECITSVVAREENGQKIIAPTDSRGQFAYLSNATSMDLSGFDTSNVVGMENMFSNCLSLVSLDLSGFDTSKVTGMSYMFCDCPSLVSVNLSGWNTSKVTDMSYMFSGCSALTTLDLSSFDTSRVTDMRSMFEGGNPLMGYQSSLKSIYVSDKWTMDSVKESEEEILPGWTQIVGGSRQMFSGCTSLVGGNGTRYDSGHEDGEYARVDKAGQPGYFTFKATHAPGWAEENGGWYYYNADGTLLKDAFVPMGGKYYYVGKNGRLVTGGWIEYGGASYHIDTDWSLAINRFVQYGGTWYYFDETAQLVVKDWKLIGGKYYYFDENARLVLNTWKQFGGTWYYFDENAQVVTNAWKLIDGEYYCFDANGLAVTNYWFSAGNDWYYLKTNGQLAMGEWVDYQGYGCHFNAAGVCDRVVAA